MIFLVICASVAVALAQTGGEANKPPLPAGPLIRRPLDFSAWVITYLYPGETPKSVAVAASEHRSPASAQLGLFFSASPRSVTLTYTNPFWHGAAENIDGCKVQQWSDGKNQYFEAVGIPGAQTVPTNQAGIPLIPNYGAPGFPDMDWISADTYTGIQSVGGHDCIVYHKDEMTAWIDQVTRYPVKWEKGGEVRSFSQLPPPSAVLVLPPEVLKISQALKRQNELLMRPIPRGG
jgi:hypothetical protein